MKSHNGLSIPDKIILAAGKIAEGPSADIRQQLIFLIDDLIHTDFNALIQLLYRIDVDEEKLKQLPGTAEDVNASSIIADIIIQRQLQKIAARKQFSNRKPPDDNDSW
ncbi:MAG: hypothetical protein ABI416_20125 [Ginsengibacter sp.]